MRTRLRPKHTDEMIAELYDHVYDHTKWDEHKIRIDWTIRRLNMWLQITSDVVRVADLSCGDGAILRGLHDPLERVYGDLVFAEHLDVIGDIMDTVDTISSGDLLICSETLEHLDDPNLFLRRAAKNFKYIAITTPLGETDPEKNYEHYWGWDTYGIAETLEICNWSPFFLETLNLPYYTYQFWIARSTC